MHDFLIDINPEMELPKYELILYTLNEIPISSLKNITGLNYKEYLLGIDELTFNIPYNRMENNGNIIKNEIYDLVEGDFLIKLNDMKYFIVYDVNEKANAESGEVYKEVKCYSREYELSDKKLINYKADSRLLYDDTNSMLEGLEKGILNYIFNHITKVWKIGYVDVDVILKEGKDVHRALDFPDTNLIQVFEKLQQTFGCIFKFDTVKQEINVYAIENVLGQHRGLYISDRNFIENLSKNIKTDGIITRLYLYGKDNISIQSISPTGQPYIDNFDFYKNTKYMTQNLIDALNNYENKVENYNPNFTPILENLQQANSDMEELLNADHVDDLDKKGLIALERYLSNLQTLIDGKVEELAILKNQISKATGDHLLSLYEELKGIENVLESYDEDKEEVNNYILAKEEQISIQQNVIDGIKQQLLVLQNELNMHTNFTEEQLKELDKFIKIETYNNADYTEYNIQELYEEGKKMLQRVSQPSIQFDLNVVDFLNVVECQHVWNKLVLGDIVTIEHKKIGFSHDVKLVQCEHDVDSHTLNLKFSNKNSFDDATLYLQELLEDFKATGTTVDFNKGKWGQVGEVESRIAKIIDGELEKARQNILNAVGQKYLHDDSGLWLYKENPDGTLSNEQIRAINNTIALTKDNWNTVSTALTPSGVRAEIVLGKLGKFAKVNAEQIEVGGWQGEYIEGNLKEYVDTQNENLDDAIDILDNTINNAFDDEYITNIEANSLKLARDNIIKEADDVKAIATSLSVSVTAINTAISDLTNSLSKYIDKANYPIKVDTTGNSSRATISTRFKALETAIVTLYKNIDEKRDSSNIKDSVNYNGTVIDKQNGITVTRSDDKVRTLINATNGIKIQGKSDNDWQDRFYVDTNGNIRITSPDLSDFDPSELEDEINDIKDLTTGITGGIVEITGNGIKIVHTGTNSKTIMDIDGFKRQIISSGNVYNYINLSHSDEATTTGSYSQTGDEYNPITPKTTSYLDSAGVGVNWITIPNLDFKNRNFVVIPSLLSIGSMNTGESGGSYTTVWRHYLKTDLKVLSYDFINGRFQIRARKCEYAMYRGDYMFENWNPVTISYYVYATS